MIAFLTGERHSKQIIAFLTVTRHRMQMTALLTSSWLNTKLLTLHVNEGGYGSVGVVCAVGWAKTIAEGVDTWHNSIARVEPAEREQVVLEGFVAQIEPHEELRARAA
eukprot:3602864-Pleurochrysis_carterae.AAC.1